MYQLATHCDLIRNHYYESFGSFHRADISSYAAVHYLIRRLENY